MQSQTDSSSTEDGGKPKVRNRFRKLALLGAAGAAVLLSISEINYSRYSQKNKYLKEKCGNYIGENMGSFQPQMVKRKIDTYDGLIENFRAVKDTSGLVDYLEFSKRNLFGTGKPFTSAMGTLEKYVNAKEKFHSVLKAFGENPENYQTKPQFEFEDAVKGGTIRFVLYTREEGSVLSVQRIVGTRLGLKGIVDKMRARESLLVDTADNLEINVVDYESPGAQRFNSSDDAKLNFTKLASYFDRSVTDKNNPVEKLEFKTKECGLVYAALIPVWDSDSQKMYKSWDIVVSPTEEYILGRYLTASGFFGKINLSTLLQQTGPVTVFLDATNDNIVEYAKVALINNKIKGISWKPLYGLDSTTRVGTELEFDPSEVVKQAKEYAVTQIEAYTLLKNITLKLKEKNLSKDDKKWFKTELKKLHTAFDAMVLEAEDQSVSRKLFYALVAECRERGGLTGTLKQLKMNLTKLQTGDQETLKRIKEGEEDASKIITSFKDAYYEKNKKAKQDFIELWAEIEKVRADTIYINALGTKKSELINKDSQLKKDLKGQTSISDLADKLGIKRPKKEKLSEKVPDAAADFLKSRELNVKTDKIQKVDEDNVKKIAWFRRALVDLDEVHERKVILTRDEISEFKETCNKTTKDKYYFELSDVFVVFDRDVTYLLEKKK